MNLPEDRSSQPSFLRPAPEFNLDTESLVQSGSVELTKTFVYEMRKKPGLHAFNFDDHNFTSYLTCGGPVEPYQEEDLEARGKIIEDFRGRTEQGQYAGIDVVQDACLSNCHSFFSYAEEEDGVPLRHHRALAEAWNENGEAILPHQGGHFLFKQGYVITDILYRPENQEGSQFGYWFRYTADAFEYEIAWIAKHGLARLHEPADSSYILTRSVECLREQDTGLFSEPIESVRVFGLEDRSRYCLEFRLGEERDYVIVKRANSGVVECTHVDSLDETLLELKLVVVEEDFLKGTIGLGLPSYRDQDKMFRTGAVSFLRTLQPAGKRAFLRVSLMNGRRASGYTLLTEIEKDWSTQLLNGQESHFLDSADTAIDRVEWIDHCHFKSGYQFRGVASLFHVLNSDNESLFPTEQGVRVYKWGTLVTLIEKNLGVGKTLRMYPLYSEAAFQEELWDLPNVLREFSETGRNNSFIFDCFLKHFGKTVSNDDSGDCAFDKMRVCSKQNGSNAVLFDFEGKEQIVTIARNEEGGALNFHW